MPEASQDFLAGIAVDLADFWEIGEAHRVRLTTMLKLHGQRDRKRLAKLLTELYYRDVNAHLSYHVKSMGKTLPKVIERLESPRRRTSAKS